MDLFIDNGANELCMRIRTVFRGILRRDSTVLILLWEGTYWTLDIRAHFGCVRVSCVSTAGVEARKYSISKIP